jgi:5-methylcytosine-specific restriction endonuclease McrA
MKKCTVCGREKSIEDFNKDRSLKSGRRAYCKVCAVSMAVNWATKNRDRVNKRDKQWKLNNPEKAKRAIKRWRANNRDKVNAYNKQWESRNKDLLSVKHNNRRARERNAEGFYTTDQWENLKHTYNFECVRCGRSEPEILLSPDHVIPLVLGGSNWIENIQPLCVKINGSRKGNCQSIKSGRSWDYR